MQLSVKKFVGNEMRRRGYVITRPTWIEKQFSKSLWREIISKDPVGFATCYQANRETLKRVSRWTDDESMASSYWRYGVPSEWEATSGEQSDRTGVDDIEGQPTQADLLAFIASKISALSYLEIGVSVGKTLLQIREQFTTANIVGLDIEEPSPALMRSFSREDLWSSSSRYMVDTLDGRPREKTPYMCNLVRSGFSPVKYLSADQFRDDTWSKLPPDKFNLIYSDGVHTGDALTSELDFIMKYNLLDPNGCVILWDDLFEIEMQTAFLNNAKRLAGLYGKKEDSISIFTMHGTYGFIRPVGMFSAF